MTAARTVLPSIEKGATYRHTLIWKDSTGNVINLTGCQAKLQVRESITSGNVLLELSTTNGGIIITPLLGKIELYLASAASTSLDGTGGVYDLEVYFSNGDVTRLIEGKISFKDEVTR